MKACLLLSVHLGLLLHAAVAPAPALAEDAMTTIQVYLADGFDNDRVVARVDGREVFAKDGVTTKRLTSLADEFSFEVPDGPVRLDLELPGRGMRTAIDLDPQGGLYVAVSLQGGRLTHYVSQTPLGFH